MSQFKCPLPISGSPSFCGDNKRFRDWPSKDAIGSILKQAPLSPRDSKVDIKLIHSNSIKGKYGEVAVKANSSNNDQLIEDEVVRKTPPIVSGYSRAVRPFTNSYTGKGS